VRTPGGAEPTEGLPFAEGGGDPADDER
jgi:hypothetical protein